MKRTALVFLISLVACLAQEESKLVAMSPDKAFRIETKEPHQLAIGETGLRLLGSAQDFPGPALLFGVRTGERLLEVEGAEEGPLHASWNPTSTHAIVKWQGYRYNWRSELIRATPQPMVIELGKLGLQEVIRKDKRPVWEREAQTFEGEADASPPFEKKKWYLTPSEWLADGILRVSAIEAARDLRASHPFEQNVAWYTIDVKITKDEFVPIALYSGGKEIWKADR